MKVMRPDRTINSDYDQTNFSVIPVSGTVALSIQCALSSLASLNLSHKQLQQVPGAGLQSAPGLLINNQISQVHDGTLDGLPDIETLDLSFG